MIEFDSSDKVTVLPVQFKQPPGDDAPFLVVEPGRCGHYGPFAVNDRLDTVTCKACGERLNPMYVLKLLAQQETRWHLMRQTYQEEMARLKERSRTKCQHCGEMTAISRRAAKSAGRGGGP